MLSNWFDRRRRESKSTTLSASAAKLASRVVSAYTLALQGISAALTVGLMLIIAYDVVMRYVFRSPTLWALTLSAAVMIPISFFVVPRMLVVGGNIDMDIFYEKFSRPWKRVCNVITNIATMTFGGLTAWLSYQTAILTYQDGTRTMGNFSIPVWWLYAGIYLGGLGIVLAVIARPWWHLKEDKTVDAEPRDIGQGIA